MLLLKTKVIFIKRNKKSKHGRKFIKKKYFNRLYVNDIPVGIITKVTITKGVAKNIKKPVFDENSFGWNQDLQDIFRKYPLVTNKKEDEDEQIKTK